MGPGGNYISLLFLWTATEFVLELRLIFRNKSSNIFCIFEMLGYNFRIVAIIKKLNKSTEWIITKKSFGFWRDRRSTPTHGFIALYVVIFFNDTDTWWMIKFSNHAYYIIFTCVTSFSLQIICCKEARKMTTTFPQPCILVKTSTEN